MRCFLAITVPAAQRQELADLQSGLRTSNVPASWTRPTSMHLTLRFLGDVPEAALDSVCAAAPCRFADVPRCTLAAHGVGAFPNRQRPVVIWSGVDVLTGDLHAAQAEAENFAKALDIPQDKKPFHPHLTLARLKTRPWKAAYAEPLRRLERRMQAHADFAGTPFEAAAVTLFSSRLRPEGAVHQPVKEFPLL